MQDNYLVGKLRRFSRYCSILVMFISFVVITGWLFDIPVMVSFHPALSSMMFNTAICFFLSGCALLLLNNIKTSPVSGHVVHGLGFAVLLIGSLSFIQYLFEVDLGIDNLIISHPPTDLEFTGRMAMNTSVNLIVAAIAIFFASSGIKKLISVSQFISLAIILFSFLPMLGFIYGIPEYSIYPVFTRMALHTAILFLIFGAGLFTAYPDRGILYLITSNSLGGYMARFLLPVSFLLPVFFIWFIVYVQQTGMVTVTGNLQLIAVLLIAVFLIFTWIFSDSIGLIDKSRTKAMNKAQVASRHLHYNIENSPLAMIEWDRQFRVMRWTKQAEELFGWKAEEVLGKSPADWKFIHEDDKEGFDRFIKKLITGVYSRNKYYSRNYTKYGDILDCLWYNSSIPDKNGVIVSILSMIDNITRQKQIEIRLRESEGQYRSLIELTQEAIFINQNNRIAYLNPAALKLFGAENQEQVLGRSPLDFFHKDYHEKVRKRIEELLDGKKVPLDEEKIVRFDGTVVDVEIAATSFFFKNEIAIQVVARDITERKKAEKMQRRNEYLLQTAGDLSKLGGWMVEVQAKKVVWSDQVAAIHEMPSGYSPSLEEGICLFAPEYRELINVVINQCLIDGTPIDEEAEIITGKNRRVWVRFTGMAEKDMSGKVINVIGAVQDITDVKIYEQNLEKALSKAEQSDKLKTAFLNNLSHEIRTPLNAIVGFSELLNHPDNSPEQTGYFTGIILKSSYQLLEIIESIINISTIEAGQIEINETETDITKTINSIYDRFREKAEAKGIELHVHNELSNNDSIVLTDEAMVNNVLSNLVDNSIKFTDKGKVVIGCSVKDEFTEFFVSDTGIGIDPSFHESVFERFQQVETELSKKRGGIGLGLPISRNFIEALNGKIWLKSIPGSGSVFYFTIPWKPLKKKKELKEIKEDHKSDPKTQLLVAEDEVSNFYLIQEMLSDTGISILHAWNGQQAVDLIKNCPDINLVLMDIKMPVMGGYEAAGQIREFRPEVPIVALTAHALHGDREKALNAGFDDYLSKPYQANNLKEIVSKYLQ
jgi:PAS domain S-box-containing protein